LAVYIYQADFGQIIMIGVIVNAVVAAALWRLVLRNRQVGSLGH
jgi:hypothetical protein